MNEILIGFGGAVAIIVLGSLALAWITYKFRA